jgi:tripartite-type tricarboxylate transporter receptor subunit TctC
MLRMATIVVAMACCVLTTVRAQDSAASYPSRAVRVIVAGAPGGNPDVLARLVSQQLAEELGKPFVVETIPGSNGFLAAQMVASSAPDGYTLMLSESGMMAINPALFSDLQYNPLTDFAPITGLVEVPTVLVVPPSLGVKTLGEFIDLAKSRPGALNYGSGGLGSIHHLTMAIFAARVGIKINHVPYRGGTELVNGLMTGEIQAGWSGIPPVQSLIESGRLRALCISTARRSKSLPDVPTAIESGVDGFDYAATIGLVAPAGTPQAIIARLEAAAERAVHDPIVAARISSLGMAERAKGTEEYANFIKQDYERFRSVVQELKLQIR